MLITVSITCAGFAALLMIFRQLIGGRLSRYDVYLIRTVLLRSVIVAIAAMMPPLLDLFGLSQAIIWHLSSFIASILLGTYVVTFPARRRAVTDIPIPLSAWITYSLSLCITLFLLLIAVDLFVPPTVGPFGFCITAFLIVSFLNYLAQLGHLVRGHSGSLEHD
jgi:hypothetical protein